MKKKYLLRLDDACPTMNREKWGRMEQLLGRYGIRPMVGVIPHNEDPQQLINSPDPFFWDKVKQWDENGWAIALHGYNHCYEGNGGLYGLNPMWQRSEFAGVPLDEQCKKIRLGVSIMREHGIKPNYFFAPSHTFDTNTIVALKNESDIRIISDTVATYPYKYNEFVFVPQVGGHCMNIPIPGLWTFCLHPNVMSDEDFLQTEEFIKTNNRRFTSFDQLNLSCVKGKSCFSKFMSWSYYKYRQIRGLK